MLLAVQFLSLFQELLEGPRNQAIIHNKLALIESLLHLLCELTYVDPLQLWGGVVYGHIHQGVAPV